MININQIKEKSDDDDGGGDYCKVEAKRIVEFHEKQVCQADIGAVVKIVATELLEPDQTNKMKFK